MWYGVWGRICNQAVVVSEYPTVAKASNWCSYLSYLMPTACPPCRFSTPTASTWAFRTGAKHPLISLNILNIIAHGCRQHKTSHWSQSTFEGCFELFTLRKVDTCLPPRPALVPMAIEMSPNAGAHSEARMVAYILAGNSWLHAGL